MAVHISVLGARDGVGKTLFAVNLAVTLARQSRKRVLVLDFDLHGCGDVAVLVNGAGGATLKSVAPNLPRVDAKSVDALIPRSSTGISVLPLFSSSTDLSGFDGTQVGKLIPQIGRLYDFIIADLGRDFNPYSLRALEMTQATLFVTTPDIFTLNQSDRYLNHLRTLHVISDTVFIVLNRFSSGSVITPQLVKQKLKKDVLLTIPEDPAIFDGSIQRATPFMVQEGRSTVGKSFDELGKLLLGSKMMALYQKAGGSKGNTADELLPLVNPIYSNFASADTAKGGDYFGKSIKPDEYIALKERVHERLIEALELKEMNIVQIERDKDKYEALKQKTREKINQLLDAENNQIKSREDRIRIAKEIFDEAIGLGPLEDLLRDPSVSEIMVNHRSQIYIEQSGKLKLTSLQFTSDKALTGVIERIVGPIGRRIDEKTPMVDARLHDGSRVNAIIPPLSLKGPMITIRKFFKEKLTYKDLVKYGTLTEEMADFVRAAVEAHLNIIVSGGTGTGKTTLLNIISSFISPDERIITVEDAAELQLTQPHVGTLEARPPNLQGEGAVTIRDLVRNTLRMRPDRIIVGECRGAEALDMLQAMNTGHDGSLTTIHSNTPRDCVRRLETLVMFAGHDMPTVAIREQIANAVDLIVQLRRFGDGSRKITHLTEIIGMEADTVTMQDIFVFKQTGVDPRGKVVGRYEATGLIPKFVEELKQKGIKLPQGMFGAGR